VRALTVRLSQTIIKPKFLDACNINVLEPITNPNHKHSKELVQKNVIANVSNNLNLDVIARNSKA
jgi:hypothetical protein